MFYLLETPVGIALFKNEGTTSFISSLKYENSNEAQNFINKMSNGEIPEKIFDFLKTHIKSTDTLQTLCPELNKAISENFKISNIKNENDHVFRSIKNNSFKYFNMSKSLFNSSTLRLAHKMVNRSEDLALIDILDSVEEMDVSINNRLMRIREWYSLHFPELNTISDNVKYLELLIKIQNRSEFYNRSMNNNITSIYINNDDNLNNLDSNIINSNNSIIDNNIMYLIANSMGSDLSSNDINKIVEDAKSILNDIKYRNKMIVLLKNNCKNLFPNLCYLLDEILIVKLIRKAGSISMLSLKPSSTIQIMGAEKAFNKAIKEKSNTPKYGIIFDCNLLNVSEKIKGKVARVLANKIALCVKVDVGGECKNGEFGKQMRDSIEKNIFKFEDQVKVKKTIVQNKKRIISVKQYNLEKDSKRVKKE